MKEEEEEMGSRRLKKRMEWKGQEGRGKGGIDGHLLWFQLNTDFIIQLGGWGDGGCGCGSSKTHNFLRSENQILKMTGLISVLSELGSRREGGAGGLSATICQGELETIRAEWKGRWLLLSGGALRAGAPDVAVHIKEQEAGSLIQEACRGERAMPQRRRGRQWVLGEEGGGRGYEGVGASCNLLEVTLITHEAFCRIVEWRTFLFLLFPLLIHLCPSCTGKWWVSP